MQTRKEHATERRVARVPTKRTGPQDTLSQRGDVDRGLLDYEAAALYLCTTTRHVRELWARRQLAAIKVGRVKRSGSQRPTWTRSS